ncbi:MAG: DUF3261 domain-containing protein [Gammaproteobacteria bacterium]
MSAALRLLCLALLLAMFAGCATTPLGPGCTRFGRDGQMCLLPPAALPKVEGSHLVKVTHAGQTDSFMGLLKIDAESLRLAGFSLFGTSLFDIEYDGKAVTSEPQQTALKPDMLVVMLELAIADPSRLSERLHGLTLKVSETDGVQVREVFESGRLIAHIKETGATLADATIRIQIPPIQVAVEMTPVSGAPASP